ncbi:MAG: class I SAM-dependent methyltransferase [Nanoarchaeota archaeon]|nr:class I SAM-dependent methyltransferase [Nanoarchaeota archaeon]
MGRKSELDFLDKEGLIKKITEKKEFSEIPPGDIELIFSKFNMEQNSNSEKIKLTRDFLRKVYSSFLSEKLLSEKKRDYNWVLMKHKSTKERLPFYRDIYSKSFKGLEKSKSLSLIDLGCGANGFSFEFLKEVNPSIKYFGVEAIGQLCKGMNSYFNEKKFNARAYHFSLFEIEKVLKLLKEASPKRVVFLLKVIDSLEAVKRNYSKELILSIAPFSERMVISFATKSIGSRKRFSAQRRWITIFIHENFIIENDFEFGGERYLIFSSPLKKDL